MLSKSVNYTSGALRMSIIGDATTWSITSDSSRGSIDDHNIFVRQIIKIL
jgi:hypothetical protein